MSALTEINLFKEQLKSLGSILKEEDIALILPILKEKSFKKGEITLNAGEVCTEAYLITKGLMRSFHQMPNGSQKTYVISCEQNLFTEHCSFVSQKPSKDFLETLEDTDVLCFSYADLMSLYEKSHQWESVGRKLSDVNFIIAKNRLRSLMNDDAPTRYRNFLKSYQNSLSRIPQHIVASYLGITPQSLSRLKREIGENL
jgi:CRP/FNR family transcriptional regulator, anaerobic regulatory protein